MMKKGLPRQSFFISNWREAGGGLPYISLPERYPNRRADNIRPYIFAYVVLKAGRPGAASPTFRFRKRFPNGRADIIRPYRTFRPHCSKGRDVEDAVPYNL